MASKRRDGGPEDAAKEPVIMTAINTIGLNKWERAEKEKNKKKLIIL